MVWVRLDAEFYGHPKILGTSLESIGVHVLGLTFAGHHLTDGLIPQEALPIVRARRKHVRELEGALLWEPVQGGWQIHDYCEHQQTREQIEAYRLANRQRVASWRARRNGGAHE